MIRRSCVMCGKDKFTRADSIPAVPIYMGVTKAPASEDVFETLEYVTCKHCGNLQLANLVPPEILYAKNHNTEVVGKIWQGHNIEFADFLSKYCKSKRVLEIGDPSAKIARKCKFDKWYIVEPTTEHPDIPKNVEFLHGWLGQVQLPENIDTVVMSHVFEHLHNPGQALDILYDALSEVGSLVISIPSMREILMGKQLPPAGMHFEHTFYTDIKYMGKLLEQHGFGLVAWKTYINHSIFIVACKLYDKHNVKWGRNVHLGRQVREVLNEYRENIEHMNDYTAEVTARIDLYGAHLPAQSMISLGLNVDDILCVLDTSSAKESKRLYGTNLISRKPDIIKDVEKTIVICHMGPYTNEIVGHLRHINPTVEII